MVEELLQLSEVEVLIFSLDQEDLESLRPKIQRQLQEYNQQNRCSFASNVILAGKKSTADERRKVSYQDWYENHRTLVNLHNLSLRNSHFFDSIIEFTSPSSQEPEYYFYSSGFGFETAPERLTGLPDSEKTSPQQTPLETYKEMGLKVLTRNVAFESTAKRLGCESVLNDTPNP